MNAQCDSYVEKYYENYKKILENMICKMTSASLSDSVSADFISQMLPHHAAAIEMSENILNYSTNCDVRAIAASIIREQTKSIADMEKIFGCCSECRNSKEDLCRYQGEMNEIMATMFGKMRNAEVTCRVSCDFMREMLPHHAGAVKMSETTLTYCICDKLKPVLKSIIRSQKQGIDEMNRLMCSIRCQF